VILLEHSTDVIDVFKFKFEYPIYSIFLEKSLIVLGLFHYKYWSEYLLCGRLQWGRTAVESLNFLTLCLVRITEPWRKIKKPSLELAPTTLPTFQLTVNSRLAVTYSVTLAFIYSRSSNSKQLTACCFLPWPWTLTCEARHRTRHRLCQGEPSASQNLGQLSFISEAIVRVQTDTYAHTHSRPTALPRPIEWSVIQRRRTLKTTNTWNRSWQLGFYY